MPTYVCVTHHSLSIACIFRHIWDVILPYLQAHHLACYCFMGAGRKHEIPISETTDCMTHSTASSMNINMFASVPHIPNPTGNTEGWLMAILGEPSIL